MKRVLIVSAEVEFYYFRPFIEASRRRGGLDVVVFDTTHFPSECHIAMSLTAEGKLDGWIDILRFCPKTGKKETERVGIKSIEVAWYLRAPTPVPKHMETEADLKFGTNEASSALNALYLTAPWRWINSRSTIRIVEYNKLFQQKMAASCGLLVPETLATNDPSAASAFAEIDGQVLLKSFRYTDIGTKEDLFCYSNIFTQREIASLPKAINECPIFAQRYVPKKYEYRVMVVGGQVLACRIDSQASEKTRVDWRHYDFDNVKHEAATLPDSVNKSLVRFMGAVGLRYGAIDLIETPDGEYVFLEVNPSGQWGWIAHYAKLPIPDAVAEMLFKA